MIETSLCFNTRLLSYYGVVVHKNLNCKHVSALMLADNNPEDTYVNNRNVAVFHQQVIILLCCGG